MLMVAKHFEMWSAQKSPQCSALLLSRTRIIEPYEDIALHGVYPTFDYWTPPSGSPPDASREG
jgi:hypothetical protein